MLSHGGAVRRGQGVDDRIVVVKIGGSLMGKEPEFSYRAEAVAPVARAIARSGVKVVVVHGGGAFGHPVAKRYGLSSSSTSRSSRGVSETRRAMFDLNIRVCDSLMAEGLRPYAFSPFPLLASAGRRGEAWLRWLLSESLTPVTFGDVVRDGEGFRVLSGDSIARQLSTLLRAERCVFAVDVEGVMGPRGLLSTIDAKTLAELEFAESRDATGGMRQKLREALEIASAGTEVAIVSGLRPAEFSKALKGLSFHGTTVEVPSRDQERRRERS